MNKPSLMVPLVVGMVFGVLGSIYLPGYVRPFIPEWVVGKGTVVTGTVVAKQKKADTLLLTVNTAEGALLATFTRKVDEIGLLVNETDTIEFTLTKYAPFIEDPTIVRIQKGTQVGPEPAPTAVRAAEKGMKESVPRPQGKTPMVAPAPGGSATGTGTEERK